MYQTEQLETWEENGVLKQIKIIKLWDDNVLLETITEEQTQEQIDSYFESLKNNETIE